MCENFGPRPRVSRAPDGVELKMPRMVWKRRVSDEFTRGRSVGRGKLFIEAYLHEVCLVSVMCKFGILGYVVMKKYSLV